MSLSSVDRIQTQCNFRNTLGERRAFLGKYKRPLSCRPCCMRIDASDFNPITGDILGAAIDVHRALGAGLLESIYSSCFQLELTNRNLRFVTQHVVPIVYKGMKTESSYRVDLIVGNLVVVEIKAVAALSPVHQSQLLTYMGLTDCPCGLLINFNVPRLMDGVKRMINPRSTKRASTI